MFVDDNHYDIRKSTCSNPKEVSFRRNDFEHALSISKWRQPPSWAVTTTPGTRSGSSSIKAHTLWNAAVTRDSDTWGRGGPRSWWPPPSCAWRCGPGAWWPGLLPAPTAPTPPPMTACIVPSPNCGQSPPSARTQQEIVTDSSLNIVSLTFHFIHNYRPLTTL